MGRKHSEKKEKLLITSNFSFSHSVFKRLVLQTSKNQGMFGKGLNLKLLSANSFSLEESKICHLLTHSHTMTPFDAPEKEAF